MFFTGLLVLAGGLSPSLQDDPRVRARDLALQLGADSVEAREDAERLLKALGASALPEVEKAVLSPDIERARRAEGVRNFIRAQMARDTLRTIEESYAQAPSLAVRVSFDWTLTRYETERKYQGSGTIELGRADQVRVALRGQNENTHVFDNLIVCDGKRYQLAYRLFSSQIEVTGVQAPEALRALAPLFVRGGTWILLEHARALTPGGPDGIARPTDFRWGEESRKSARLEYRLASETLPERRMDVTLWYEPETYRLLRRSVDLRGPDEEGRFIDVYEECARGIAPPLVTPGPPAVQEPRGPAPGPAGEGVPFRQAPEKVLRAILK